MVMRSALDAPVENELVYQHGFQVSGWVDLPDGEPWQGVRLLIGDHIIGASWYRLPRPDVAVELGSDRDDYGFLVRCTVDEGLRSGGFQELRAEVYGAQRVWAEFGRRTVRFSEIDYRIHGHGVMVTDQAPEVFRRDDVFLTGPPSPVADPVTVDLVMRYLRAGQSVLDLGCGWGAYRDPLERRGLRWTGCEASQVLLTSMRERGLPAVPSVMPLPFADSAFDATLCVEVLEHVADYDAFLAEASRVSKTSAIFTVPNFGALPITSSVYMVPWHMMEPDHKNFFTARSLQQLLEKYYRYVETFEYGPLDHFRSHDGIVVNNHVVAICLH